MVNEDLIRKTVALMEEHRENWDQRDWVGIPEDDEPICGTTLCFAGFTLVAEMGAGEFFDMVLHKNWDGDWYADTYDIEYSAKTALGLDYRQAYELFMNVGITDLDDYKALITEVTGVTFP